jgi:Ca2+-binding RTX toxin-like protein
LQNGYAEGGAAWGDVLSEIEGVFATEFNDFLFGGQSDDRFYGGAGSDLITGEGGDDLLVGGGGADTLVGVAGNDTLWGEMGADILSGGDGFDFAGYRGAGGYGVTVDLGVWSNNTGEAEGDSFFGIEGLIGSGGSDILLGDAAANQVLGGRGADHLLGRQGDDSLFGDDGDDTLSGDDGNDALFGGAGADRFDGGAGFDTVFFNAPGAVIVDLITPSNNRNDAAGDTFLFVEVLSGSALGDGFYGDTLDNYFIGNGGNDALVGRGGNDTLVGGADGDFINGGTGLDQLYGGAGADRFVFAKGDGGDVIYDFSVVEGDVIQCQKALLGNLQSGAAVAQKFGIMSGGNAVLDFGGGDRIVFVGVNSIAELGQAIQII